MKNFRDISEARGDTAVFTFGRFNPPTTGHEKVMEALAAEQKKNAGSMMYVYASQSQNAKKDPLPYAKKIAYMKKMFPKYKNNIVVSRARNIFEIAVELHNKGHRAIVMVVGSDRVAEFDDRLNRYNGVDARHGYYGFDNIQIISAGERDADSDGVEGMSASKMRAAASENRYENEYDTRGKLKKEGFEAGLPEGFADGKKLFADVRKHMGIREERDMGDMTDFEILRDMYLTGKLWNVGDLVEANGHEGRIINKGTNYLSFVTSDGKVQKTWLHNIELNERDYKKEYENYHSKPEQIERRSSRNKARRAMGDKAVKGMDVGHKDNNPMNNDPSNLKMEDPSDNRREPRLREKTYMRTDSKLKNLKVPVNRKKGKILNRKTGKFEDVVEVKQDKQIKDREGTQPAKYYAKDTEGDAMAKSTKQARARHFDKKKTGPAPGDASATTKPSKHTKKFKQMYGEKLGKDADAGDYIDDFEKSDAPQFKGKSKEKRKDMAIAAFLDKQDAKKKEEVEVIDEKITALVNKAKKTGMPYGILKKVYDRGMAAYKTGHRPGASPQQWALARVNSFTTKSAGTWGKADKDLAAKVRASESYVVEEPCCDDCAETSESLWKNIQKKRERIKRGSGERMRKKGEKGAPTAAQMARAKSEDLNEWGEVTEKAEYQGRPVELNNPTRGDTKKYKVYVKNDKGNVIKVEFGDPNMSIKRDDPEARKNFRARHNCDQKKDKTTAGYWSCKFWSTKSVTDLMKG